MSAKIRRRDLVTVHPGHVSESFLVKGQLKAAAFLETFVDYPPSQRPASFNVEGVRKQVDRKIDEAFKKRGIE